MASHVGIKQREFGVDRCSFRQQAPAMTGHAERNTGRGHDVEDLIFEMLRTDKCGDRSGDLRLVVVMRDLFVRFYGHAANICRRDVSTLNVILGDALRERRRLIDDNEYVLRVLAKKCSREPEEQGEFTHSLSF